MLIEFRKMLISKKGYWAGKERARGTFWNNKNVLHLDLHGGY